MKSPLKLLLTIAAFQISICVSAQSTGGYGYGTPKPNVPPQSATPAGIPIPAGTGTNQTGTPATPPNNRDINQQIGTTIPQNDSNQRRKSWTGNDTIGTVGSQMSKDLNKNIVPKADTLHQMNRRRMIIDKNTTRPDSLKK